MEEKTITITREELFKASAHVIATGSVKEVLSVEPMFILLLSAYTAELGKALFEPNSNESESEEK